MFRCERMTTLVQMCTQRDVQLVQRFNLGVSEITDGDQWKPKTLKKALSCQPHECLRHRCTSVPQSREQCEFAGAVRVRGRKPEFVRDRRWELEVAMLKSKEKERELVRGEDESDGGIRGFLQNARRSGEFFSESDRFRKVGEFEKEKLYRAAHAPTTSANK